MRTIDTIPMSPAERLEDSTAGHPTPNDMPLKRAAGVFFKLPMEVRKAPETTEQEPRIMLPHEGGTYKDEDGSYIFQPALAYVRDSRTGARVEKPYSLRMWFAHHTDEISGGPGWDGRFHLAAMSPDEQLRRYGHEFTIQEIRSPGGYPTGPGGQLEGGMPDDIVYYELKRIDEDSSDDLA
jgi:hypothetical protein